MSEEFVRDFLEAVLVRDLATANEEAEGEVGGTGDAGVEGGEGAVHEFVEGGGLGGPVVFVVFAGFVAAGEFERCSDEGRGGVFYTFIAVGEGLSGSLEKLKDISC